MERRMTVSGGLFATLFVLAIAGSAFAGQDRASAGAPAGGGGGSAASGASAGSSGNSGGGSSMSSGGGSVSGGDRGGSRGDHGRAGATGGMGVAMPRGGGEHHAGGGGATPRTAGGGASRVESGERTNATPGRVRDGSDRGVPEHARPRDGQPTTGTAVPRPAGSIPPTTGGSYTIVPGAYYGGYYGLYPWMMGGIGYYGGYYDPFYDPWYGGYPSYPQTTTSAGYDDEGSLRLKIKPKNAEVYVDGYYVGIVDEFDGIFQRLHIDPGSHRVEVRANGYETLVFDVRITPDHTTTYQGEMKRIQ